jgi:hypothetical protein
MNQEGRIVMPKFRITAEDTIYTTFDIIADNFAEARVLAEQYLTSHEDELHWKHDITSLVCIDNDSEE